MNMLIAFAKIAVVGFLFSELPSTAGQAIADTQIIAKETLSVKEEVSEANIDYVYISDFREQDKQFSDKDLAQLLYCVGFRGVDLREAWAVAKKESNGRPLAYNGNERTGDNSYGIFQINMIDGLGPDRRDKFELQYNRDLLDPVTNAQVAFHMSRGGQNWISWKGMTPRTKEWLAKYPSKFKPSPCKEERPKKKD